MQTAVHLLLSPPSELEMEMDNSLAVAGIDEKVCIYLPHDIVLFILSKLPLKSLKRFLCVCKSWSFLFANPDFMKMYCNNILSNDHSYYDDSFLVLHKLRRTEEDYSHCEFYWLSDDRFENWVKLDWPPQFQENDIDIFIVGSVSINGILYLKQGFKHTHQVVLWNPTTSESKVIPTSPVENIRLNRTPWFFLHGFGYDHFSDDYKLVQMIDYFPDNDPINGEVLIWEDRSYDPLWEIYSLKSNSWKKLDIDMRNCYYYTSLRGIGLYTDGVFHWWAKSESKNIEECLLSFDFCNEVLFTTPLPSNMDGRFDALQEILHFARGRSPCKMLKALANGRLPGVLPGVESPANLLIANELARALAPGKCAPSTGPGSTPGKLCLHDCMLF